MNHQHYMGHDHTIGHTHGVGSYQVSGAFDVYTDYSKGQQGAEGAFSVSQGAYTGESYQFSGKSVHYTLSANKDNGFSGASGDPSTSTSGWSREYTDYTRDYTDVVNLSHRHGFTPSGSNSYNGGIESRPSNATVRLWKRTA